MTQLAYAPAPPFPAATPRRSPAATPAPEREVVPAPAATPTHDHLEAFGREMDALRERVRADLGERDARYIRRLLKTQRRLALAGRALLFAGVFPPAWIAGTSLLALAKILENMEIGHNVMHGQYDFTKDPALSSQTYEWDTTCPAAQWRHSHNYMHHTFTNVVGKDRDVGYGILRMAESQPWSPRYLAQPLYATLLALFFEWGVALHDLETEKLRTGEKSVAQVRQELRPILRKIGRQVLKDYVLFPLLAGPFFLPVLLGNVVANLVRNVWAFMVIFCGHFPDGTVMFDEATLKDETRAGWYRRQLLGSANISGGPLLHIMTGNLSHQIEHHLFPDLPAHRYAEMSVEVRAACERHGLPYNTGGLGKQFGSVVRRIVALALPSRSRAAQTA